ncbi:MAG: GNAT family N-acetyltransferase [Candidatus Bathyarchaeia archaeon]
MIKHAPNKKAEKEMVFKVKRMSSEDIEFAVRITDTMNWNLTEQDFAFMMQLEPEGCFALLCDSEKIGIATTICYGKIGWIGNVVVDEKYRRKGAGSTIVKHAIDYLKSKGAETIGLYAYKEKANFYARLGFKHDLQFAVLNGKVRSSSFEASNVKEAEKTEMRKIIEFDNFYFGASREKLLQKIVNEKDNLCYRYVDDGEILGYVMAKVYGHYAEIGPLICRREKGDIAKNLLGAALKKVEGAEVSMCLPKREKAIINMLFDFGFRESFTVVRMFSGPIAFRDCIYIAESLERG